MRCEKSLFFSLVLVGVALLATFAQGQSTPQARLTIRQMVKHAPAQANAAAPLAAASTPGLPLWSFNVHSDRDGNNYSGVMVGSNPFHHDSGRTNVRPRSFPSFSKRTLWEPALEPMRSSQPNPATIPSTPRCPIRLALVRATTIRCVCSAQSPIFKSADFNYGGTDVGRTQTTDAFQRASFWKVIDREDYHVTLGPISTFNAITVDVPAASGLALATTSLGPPAFCAPMAIVDGNMFDLFLNNNILPALAPHGVNHGTFPVFLLYNAVLSDGGPTNLLNCGILGYHGTGNNDPTATYSPMDFDATGLFGVSGLDIATASHEVAEWMDDPFGNNPTRRPGYTPDRFPDVKATSRWAIR